VEISPRQPNSTAPGRAADDVWHPDFVAIYFYKMFGWPTESAASSPAATRSPGSSDHGYRAGRSSPRSCSASTTKSVPDAAHFKDGTVNYLNLAAAEISLPFLDRIGIERIRTRGDRRLTPLDSLGALRHSGGSPAATMYGPRPWDRRGAAIAFNFLHRDGSVVDARHVDRVASRYKITLRTGCFCNPGAGEVAFTSRETLVGREFGDGTTLDDYIRELGLHSGGAIRGLTRPGSNPRIFTDSLDSPPSSST
jgi:selenocysteine lyase/cysteine desulfurase